VGPWGSADLHIISPPPGTNRSQETTTDMGLAHRVVYPFTHQLSVVLINQPWTDGTLSWHWYTAAMGWIRTTSRSQVPHGHCVPV